MLGQPFNHLRIAVVKNNFIAVERGDLGKVLFIKGKIENGTVFQHTRHFHRFRDNGDTALIEPAQHHLSHRFAVFLGDCG